MQLIYTLYICTYKHALVHMLPQWGCLTVGLLWHLKVCNLIQHESDEQYCSFLSSGCRTFRAVALCQLLQDQFVNCSSDSCCINKRSYEPLRNHMQFNGNWGEPERARLVHCTAGHHVYACVCMLILGLH